MPVGYFMFDFNCYNQYNAKQLLELLCVLEEDEQPSRELFETKVQIRIITAKKLNVGVNDVIKLSKNKKVERKLRKVNEDLCLSIFYFINNVLK